jgi:protein-S-isoprenylcysteine O-methyltransferase Ste14
LTPASDAHRLERFLDALLAASSISWAALGLLHDGGPPLAARLGAAAVNATAGVLFLVREPVGEPPRWQDGLRALPSILVGAAAWKLSGPSWPEPLAHGFLAVSLVACLALAWLGSSFAVLAARRTLRTSGPYRLVRHPIYALELALSAIAAGAFAWWAAPIAGFAAGLALAPRIAAEEQRLAGDPAYDVYARTVRFRLVPGLY